MDRSPRAIDWNEAQPFRAEDLHADACGLVRDEWPEALERRGSLRRSSGLPVRVLWGQESASASLENLSRGGLGLRTDAGLRLGADVRVELEGNATIAWECRVVQRREVPRSLTGMGSGSVGLELKELSPTLELLLRD